MKLTDPKPPPFPPAGAPPFPRPADLAEWRRRRPRTQGLLRQLLGALPPRPARPEARTLRKERRRGYLLEKLSIDNGAGARIPAWLLVPEGPGPFPGILYSHWHAGQYDLGKDELWTGAPDRHGTRGETLVRRGYAVLAIDAYGFGERSGQGPGGPRRKGSAEEMDLSKAFLWMGRTLWGMMVRDDQIALDVLVGRAEVDPGRIGATGISMGSTRSWWLAGLDERVASTAGVCCLTRAEDLLRARALGEHGIYYFVPGLLRHFDTEAVVSLIAPRPLLLLSGGRDPGSPASGVRTIHDFCREVYRLHGRPEAFRGVLFPRVGHRYTPSMWTRMLAWFDRTLRPTT